MELHSEAIAEDRPIPRKYTSEGENISPPLRWEDSPDGAREFALILEDVKTTGERRFTHWVLYGIGPDRHELPEGIFHQRRPEEAPDVVQGRNSLGNVGYDGPQPPMGSRHHYRFRLLALDRPTGLEAGAGREALEESIEGHVLDEAILEAIYERPRE
jgi:hypothetical protein